MRSGNRAHRGETSKPRAAYEPHQNGLSLIVHRVPYSYSITSILTCDVHQEFISHRASDFFDSSLGRFGNCTNVD